jgi:hypothetical protein
LCSLERDVLQKKTWKQTQRNPKRSSDDSSAVALAADLVVVAAAAAAVVVAAASLHEIAWLSAADPGAAAFSRVAAPLGPRS